MPAIRHAQDGDEKVKTFDVEDQSGAGVTQLKLPERFKVFDAIRIKKGGTQVYTDKAAIEAAAKHIPANNPLLRTTRWSDEERVDLVIFCVEHTGHVGTEDEPVVYFERRATLSGERDSLRQRTQRISGVKASKRNFISSY